jgi:hypothetical protein
MTMKEPYILCVSAHRTLKRELIQSSVNKNCILKTSIASSVGHAVQHCLLCNKHELCALRTLIS